MNCDTCGDVSMELFDRKMLHAFSCYSRVTLRGQDVASGVSAGLYRPSTANYD